MLKELFRSFGTLRCGTSCCRNVSEPNNPEGMKDRVAALAVLPLETDTEPDLDRAMALAETHRLTFYDALYLELALRRRAGLVTLDAQLRDAAMREAIDAGPM